MPKTAAHLITNAMRVRGGLTKRTALEKEFGLPFHQAKQLRMKYYQQGYSASRQRVPRSQVASLRARLAGALSEITRLRVALEKAS